MGNENTTKRKETKMSKREAEIKRRQAAAAKRMDEWYAELSQETREAIRSKTEEEPSSKKTKFDPEIQAIFNIGSEEEFINFCDGISE